MKVDVRLIGAGEVDAWVRSVSVPFLEVADQESYEHWRPALEFDRTWAALDGEHFVGNACVFSLDLTLPAPPGAPAPVIPMAGVSGVGVHPTHRRRGILHRLMGAMLRDAAGRGEALAGLQASEAGIYGRFGFGCATSRTRVTVAAARSRFDRPVPPLQLRLCDVAEAAEILPALFDRLRRTRGGQPCRRAWYWADLAADRPSRRQGASGQFLAVGDDGYATWRIVENQPVPDRARLVVDDLIGATPEVEAGLWRFLLDIDLVDEVVFRRRPVEDPLRWRLADPRAYQVDEVADFLWLRVLDVPAALSARGFRCEGRLVLEVDPLPAPGGAHVPDRAAGRWTLDAGPDGACCRAARRGEETHLRLGTADLGAVLLGGVPPSSLAWAGRIAELRPGALDRADALLAAHPSPFAQTGF
ncbi:MAG: GNAT family N-acetyltransferase [Acidimicrobiales bacterium]